MTIFYILYFIILVSCILTCRDKKIGLFLMSYLFVVLTFRGVNVGSDTIMYYNNDFYANLEFSLESKFEISFQLISYAINMYGINPRWCLYSLSFLTFLFLYLSVKRYHKLFGTSYVCFFVFYFLLGFYALAFNISRQMLAVSILLYAYSFLFENNRKRLYFLFYTLLASSFHISSIIFLPVIFINKISVSKISFIHIFSLLFILFTVVVLSKNYILSYVMSKFGALEIYGTYVEDAATSDKSFLGMLIDYIEFFMSMFVYYWLSKKIQNTTLSNLFLLSIIVDIILMAFYGNIYRIRLGITIFQVVAFATCFTYHKSFSSSEKFVFYFTLLFFGYFLLTSLSNGAYDIVPYYLTL